jgi:iron complex transport system ATP-binding protein
VARRLELLDLLHRVARDRGIAVVLSTHELDLALRHADRLLVLDNKGGGRIMLPGAGDVAAQIAEVFGMRMIAMGGGAEAATGDRAANEAGRK